jgi:hypothetical protein
MSFVCLRVLAHVPRPRRSDDDPAVLLVKGKPRDLLAKLKAAAALQQQTLGEFIQEMCATHAQDLKKNGLLPMRKGLGRGDVGPTSGQILTRTDDFFSGLNHLTLPNKLIRRQVAERAVRAALIIVESPGFNDLLGLSERAELVHAQTLAS